MTNTIPPEAPADCPLCPRLVAYREEVAEKHPDWFNGAVPSFGPETAELLIIGLAPGVTGANRTGRPFTGDWAGDLLYATIDKFGYSTGKFDARPDDGLKLKRAMITNAVRCVPPQNKPVGAEINQCRQFLTARIDALPKLKAMVCLGKISHDSTVRTLGLKLKDYPFGHGTHYNVEIDGRKVALISSYHCSRYNTNTGRLTAEMFEDVFAMAKKVTG
ncbi:uracil-DNA glycosylase [Hyphomonas pacifica]|uniref:Type-5 uracil-DNA glycosylase n=1 Tax=Hyphomonas pacifica TaxID=1280941 RepID=A0A062TVJ4_9PROT|nr:uracil-DNA glycosylase [Hyphomonas pacifica]KCZ47364.1 uracil-DNA glycosylase [Hyphomonas pacifica]RAN31280.1 uracil-DNA glycosylase [Hyphomonas pacifica]RAN38340.1 uracil-DNA glycosylase [Hyphomonas pacifica]